MHLSQNAVHIHASFSAIHISIPTFHMARQRCALVPGEYRSRIRLEKKSLKSLIRRFRSRCLNQWSLDKSACISRRCISFAHRQHLEKLAHSSKYEITIGYIPNKAALPNFFPIFFEFSSMRDLCAGSVVWP